ncbi:FHA domain-containing protein [Pseudorhodoferax sp.]|uniref:FHA domain-containing protein n=1 Tax=Pseudorhodoferax sp. TaxID=1993553 RepID=UPI0039E2B3D0
MSALRIRIEGDGGPSASAVFGEKGGTLGRSRQNTLVLSDAERSVSRLHARVDWRDDGFRLVNMGLNPVIHNGARLGPADESPLGAGDVLRIGRFSLLVEAAHEDEQPLDDEDALYDDMTGEPLPRRSARMPPFALFDDSTAVGVTGRGRPTDVGGLSARAQAGVATELLRGMGCAAPAGSQGFSAEQTGQLLRRAIEDTLRTWIPHCSPAVQQAWFTSFEEALARVAQAEAVVRER